MTTPPAVEDQRHTLDATVFDAPTRLRIMVVAGATVDGVTTAGLLRALRGLGHRVFHIDPAVHGDVAPDSPSCLDLRPLARALDRFAPHVLVLGGASYVLPERDAADLRQRGIVSLALGFAAEPPSATDARARRTDYVTVPRPGRIGNILPFLPGVDRDTVVQHLPPPTATPPEVVFAEDTSVADDRRRTAALLAATFRTASVGSGSGTPAEGGARLQTLRSAGVHIAFLRDAAGAPALTSALFEGVAAGAVVCVPAGAELSACFEAGTDVAVFDDAGDLEATITRLLADPAEADGYRRRAFARLAAEHLYEHRWNTVLTAVLADLRNGESGHHTRCLERISGETAGRPRTVVISGWYGARNTGDDLVLESIAQALEAGVPDLDLVVASPNDPATVLADHGLPAVHRHDPYATDDVVMRSTAVVVGGGGLWMDYSFRAAGGVAGVFALATNSPSNLSVLPVLAGIRRRPVFVHGMGVGPLDDPDARELVRFTGDLCQSVTVRDHSSAQLLRSIPGWSTPVEVAPDVVYGLPVGELPVPRFDRAGTGTVLAVNVRPWGDPPDVEQQLAEVLRAARREHGALLVGVPMMRRDEKQLAALFAAVTADDDGAVPAPVLLPWTSGPEQLLADLGACDALVSMRLHGCLLAHRARIPAVGLQYDSKVAEHFAELGRESFAIPLGEIGSRLPGALTAALGERNGLPADLLAAIGRAEDAARDSLRRLAESVAAVAPPPPRADTIRHTNPPYARTAAAPVVGGFDLLPAEESGLVDLRDAQVVGGNLDDPDRRVEVVHRPGHGGRTFHLTARGPGRGDFAAFTVEVPGSEVSGSTAAGDGVRAEILLRVPYKARPDRTGRLAWQVLLDGVVVLTEDVAGWDERCTAWVAWTAREQPVELTVRVIALRDCEQWGWGPAAAVTVRGIRTSSWSGTESVVAGTSIPPEVVLPITAVPAPVSPARRARRWGRGGSAR